MNVPEHEILPESCAAKILEKREFILDQFEAALESREGYDHGTACQYLNLVEHSAFLYTNLQAMSDGRVLDDGKINQMADTAQQMCAWFLHELDLVNSQQKGGNHG